MTAATSTTATINAKENACFERDKHFICTQLFDATRLDIFNPLFRYFPFYSEENDLDYRFTYTERRAFTLFSSRRLLHFKSHYLNEF